MTGTANVTALIDGATGTTTGDFEYGPFGETIRLTPNANNQSPFRFSTKYTDDESDFIYYGYRYYNPSAGRWLSRDPLEEKGSENLYAFIGGATLDYLDVLGLKDFKIAFYGVGSKGAFGNLTVEQIANAVGATLYKQNQSAQATTGTGLICCSWRSTMVWALKRLKRPAR